MMSGIVKAFCNVVESSCRRETICNPKILKAVVQTRDMTRRRDCEKPEPKCGLEGLKKRGCVPGGEKKKKEEKSVFVSMWENPECCKDPCPDAFPRFDDLYYKPSDKAKRVYLQTWIECTPYVPAPRPKCVPADTLLPIQRRPRKPKVDGLATKFGDCGSVKPPPSRCERIQLPCCRTARIPPKCTVNRLKKDCKKICAPYPSYSECVHPPPPPKRPRECGCLFIPAMCDVYAAMRKRRGR